MEAIEFEQRLKHLKAESEARKAEAAAAAAAGGGVLDAGRRQQEEDIYANVQPLSKSLLGSQDDSPAAKEYEGAQFGPSQVGARLRLQRAGRRTGFHCGACVPLTSWHTAAHPALSTIRLPRPPLTHTHTLAPPPPPPPTPPPPAHQAGLAVAAVLLGAVFLLTSGGADFAPDSPPAATVQQGAAAALGEEQRAEVQAQLAEVQARLAANADDLEAVEAAAVLNARLGNFAVAEQQLSKLTAARPGDGEALRVLAEAQAAQAKWGAAAGSYRKAWEAGGRGSLEVLQGLAGGQDGVGRGGRSRRACKAAAHTCAVCAFACTGCPACVQLLGLGRASPGLLAEPTIQQWSANSGRCCNATSCSPQLLDNQPALALAPHCRRAGGGWQGGGSGGRGAGGAGRGRQQHWRR